LAGGAARRLDDDVYAFQERRMNIAHIYAVNESHGAIDGVVDGQLVLVDYFQRAERINGTCNWVVRRKLGEAMRPSPHLDVVHFYLPMAAWRYFVLLGFSFLLLKLIHRGLRIVVTVHEWKSLRKIRRLILMPCLLFCDQITVPTEDVAATLKESLSTLRSRVPVSVVSIGPNLIFKSSQPSGKAKNCELLIGSFGSLYAPKQPVRFLDLLGELRDQGCNARMRFVGDFIVRNSKLRKDFFETMHQRRLDKQVEFIGAVPDNEECAQLLRDCDVFLNFYRDGFTERNGSVLASLGFGAPSLVTRNAEQPPLPKWLDEYVREGRLVLLDNALPLSELAAAVRNAGGHRFPVLHDLSDRLWFPIVENYWTLYRLAQARPPLPTA
jgi:glycosyltransferase involved in cell wall biosynthesis